MEQVDFLEGHASRAPALAAVAAAGGTSHHKDLGWLQESVNTGLNLLLSVRPQLV